MLVIDQPARADMCVPGAHVLDRRGGGGRGALPGIAACPSDPYRHLRLSHPPGARHLRHRLPQYEWRVTAAPDEAAYSAEWWRHRALAGGRKDLPGGSWWTGATGRAACARASPHGR